MFLLSKLFRRRSKMSFSKSLQEIDSIITEIQPKKQEKQEKKEKQPQPKKSEKSDDPKVIFSKTRIQVSKIVKAEYLENADALVCFSFFFI
jgi:hypothetical protein